MPMRKAINENPLVQIGLLAVLALVVAVVFLMQMGGGEDSPPAPAGAPVGAEPAASATGTAAPPATPTDDSKPGAPAKSEPADTAPATPEPVVTGTGIEPTEGLPASFARAYEDGETVAIFVVRDEPLSDKVVAGYADRLRGESRVAVFEIEPSDLAEWVRVTGPVGVDRTPALVVVSPKAKVAGAEPTASVSYGFRNYESVRQAVADARYDGPVRGYDPD
jgi:hypothetical protein